MTDNTRAKVHLKESERKLNDLSTANIPEINRITAARSLELFNNLHIGNNLFVDDEVRTDIENVHNRLQATGLAAEARAEIIDLNAQEIALPVGAGGAARRAEIGRERSNLLKITGGTAMAPGVIHDKVRDRRNEYSKLRNYSNYFDTSSRINNIDVDITVGPPRLGPNINQNLDPLFKTIPGNPNANYSLCDDQGVALPQPTPGNYTIQIGGQTATISGINLATRNLDLTNINIVPPNVDLSQPLKLSVNATYPATTVGVHNINIVCNKKFQLQLRNGPVPVPMNTQALRQGVVDTYNNAGAGNVIVNAMNANHANNIARLEREAFFRAVAHGDGPKFDKLTPQQKEDLYQNVRNLYIAVPPPAWAVGLANINNYNLGVNGFRNRITADAHPSNNPTDTANNVAYRNYINNNLEDQIINYFNHRLDEVFTNNYDANTYLKTEVTNYLTGIENNKIDNNTHQDVDADIAGAGVEKMENRRRFGILGRRDVNYMRFFSGSKLDIPKQTVNINTNNHPEDLNNPTPVDYKMDLEISGRNEIKANITIGKEKLSPKAGDIVRLVRTILSCQQITHGKVRMHIVYNIIKGLIEMAKQKNISLSYRNGDHNMIIRMDGKNIVLEDQDDQTNFGGTNRRITEVLFDYQLFENTNQFDNLYDNRSLRTGIDYLMDHFNYAMNSLHTQYRQATERRRLGLRRGQTRMTLPTSFRLSPIKKIMNFRTTTNFDFTTNVNSNGKNISISFKKNKFTFNMDGLKKPISFRSLGNLLNYRKGGVRIFDGIERDICEKIYESLINKMRENTKISRTSFGVRDCTTGRIYILDEDGKFGYVNAEYANTHRNMVRRGRLSGREYGVVPRPPAGRLMCSESETKELFKNPFIMGRLIKTMNNRMGIISSTRTLWD